jgi:hypothetical protein
MRKPIELKKDNYTIQVNWSKDAKKNKLMKFISKSGDEFVISAEEMTSILVGQVNSETLEATFVESDRINVVEVGRQLECVLDKDMKKGEKIRINYTHPYPIEFALIEEAAKIAKINKDVPAVTLTKEYIDEVKSKIKPEMTEYIEKFYKSFKNLKENN